MAGDEPAHGPQLTASGDARFRAFPQFERPELKRLAHNRGRVDARVAAVLTGGSLAARIGRALCARRCIHLKELLESFEFHQRTRRRLRAPQLADLCCGHGLTGLLFATESQVERVTLVDRRPPESYASVLDAVASVCPEIRDKVRYLDLDLERCADQLQPGTSCLAVHACGQVSDHAITVALGLEGSLALMPCCYSQAGPLAPPALRQLLGRELATDVHRAYRLIAAGRQLQWAYLPRAITPMNRVLLSLVAPTPAKPTSTWPPLGPKPATVG